MSEEKNEESNRSDKDQATPKRIEYCTVEMLRSQTGQDTKPDGRAEKPLTYEKGKKYDVSRGLAQDLKNMGAAQILENKNAGAAPEDKGSKKATKKRSTKKTSKKTSKKTAKKTAGMRKKK